MGTRIEKTSDQMSTRLRYIENRTKELEKLLADNAFEPEVEEDEAPGDGPGNAAASDARTERLIRYGRGVRKRRLLRPRNVSIAGAALAVVIVIVALTVLGGGASWPASVTTVRAQILTACQNPERSLRAGPGQLRLREVKPAGAVGVLLADQ